MFLSKKSKEQQHKIFFSRQVCGILNSAVEPKYFKHPENYQKIISRLNLVDNKYGTSKLSNYAHTLSAHPSIKEYLSYIKYLAKVYPYTYADLSADALMGIGLACLDLEIANPHSTVDRFYRDTAYRLYLSL